MSSSQAMVMKLYQDVIDDVVRNMKQEFENDGIDDQILQELQNIWEIKLQEMNKFDNNDEDDNESVDDYSQDDSRALYMYPHQGSQGSQYRSNSNSLQEPPYYDDIPQSDGPGDRYPDKKNEDREIYNMVRNQLRSKDTRASIPQLDGDYDDDEDQDKAADLGEEGGSEYSNLGDDLDSSGDGEPETDDLVLCLFDKVTRTKNKWKTTLKDGVMRLNGRDYVFHKGQGEFEW